MTRKKQIKTQALPVPATQPEAERLLSRIGELQGRVTRLELDQQARIQAINESFGESVAAVNEEITATFQALHAWAEAHKGELLKGDAKTAKLATGTLSWRSTPPAVKVTKTDKVLEQLHAKRLFKFIRSIEEVDKEALLRAYGDGDEEAIEGIAGIKITSREEFVAKPYASELERVETVKTTKERRAA